VAERRLVSVLFADLVGFTPFAEEKDPEEVRELLGRYFDVAREVVERYGGTVEKFIGDAVTALWGAPVAHEDDAERAVRAALELADAVTALGPGIQARCGVLTGEAAVTLGAAFQGLVAGDLVNTAARLQAAAPPGAVLVGEATMRASSAAIMYEAAGEQNLKGRATPVPAWRALRVVAERGGRGRSHLPEPPFVGRHEDLRLLRDALTAVGRDGRARLVLITGPAGIGKSRLAWEFEKWTDGVTEPIWWHRGRSPSYGEGITFWALGEMVRRRAGLAETDDEATTRARIAATVAEQVPGEEDRRWVEPALLTLLGLEPAPAGGRDRLFAAWRIFFERIAEKGTTVLLFEDLQWADSGLLDFIEHLLAWSHGSPILVVALARPELLERRPGWGSTARSSTTLALEPLDAAAMRRLLEGFVPGLPEAATRAILDRADGVPLYAVETVRALVAEGRLELADGAYRPTGDLGALTVPASLHSLIASRLDALDPADRALLQAAAVVGQSFPVAALAAATGQDEADLAPHLSTLVRRELLAVEAHPRSPERGQHRFVQSLIREVAYRTLARRDRRALHLAVARWYERLGDEELAGALASHYLEAYRASSSGREADAVAVQARLALRGAAERAAGLGAHGQAIALLEQALEVTAEAAEQAELLLRAARSADAASRYAEGIAFAERAAAAFEAAGDPMGVARAGALRGVILLDAARIAEARDALEATLAGLDDDAEPAVRAEILANLSRALMRSGESARAIEVADRALEIAERYDLELIVAETLNNKGSSLGYLGRWREAVALLEGAVRAARDGGFVGAEVRALSNLGVTIYYSGHTRRGREVTGEALALARRLGHQPMTTWLLGTTIEYAYRTGSDWDLTLADGEEFLATVRDPVDEFLVLTFTTIIRVARGEPVDAAFARIRELQASTSDPSDTQLLHILRALRRIDAGDEIGAWDEAMDGVGLFAAFDEECVRVAARAAALAGDAERLGLAAERLATLPRGERALRRQRGAVRAAAAALAGRRDEAIAGFRDVVRAWTDEGDDWEAAADALVAVVLLGADDPVLAELAALARTVFERVGARPSLARLDAALAHWAPGAAAAADPAEGLAAVVPGPAGGADRLPIPTQ
jgi:class 3 adenylate cyclase/tetratricopeptide (TPR) repeat protein